MCTQTAHTEIFFYMAILTFFWIFKSKPKCAWCVHILMSHFSMLNTYPISILWYIVYSLTHTEYGDMTSQNHMSKISKIWQKLYKNFTKIWHFFWLKSRKNLTKISTFLIWIILLSNIATYLGFNIPYKKKKYLHTSGTYGLFWKNRKKSNLVCIEIKAHMCLMCAHT